MLKKRIIGVVNVIENMAVQSFGYSSYLPLGNPVCIVENLDRWGADEILLNVINRSKETSGPNLKLLAEVAKIGIGTPLVYSGGIRNLNDGKQVIQTGADRICINQLIYGDLKQVEKLSELIGLQGVLASLPLKRTQDEILYLNYLTKELSTLPNNINTMINKSLVSEIILVDYSSEGKKGAFNENILKENFNNIPLIVQGGINQPDQIIRILKNKKVSAVGIGNSLNYQEHKIQKLKNLTKTSIIRKENYLKEGFIDV